MEALKLEKVSLEDVPHLSASPEQKQKGFARFNLRKSLAWDSAFFTGEGILNPEELAIMNNAQRKVGITLPEIQEFRKSSESTSTFESDRWSLEQLEEKLFENVRESIQRSFGDSNHTTNSLHCEKLKEEKKPDASTSRPLKKSDASFQMKLKPSSEMSRHNVSKQQQGHTSKGGLVCTNVPLHGNAESKPVIRPPIASSRTVLLSAPVSGKKAFNVTRANKTNTGKSLADATFKPHSSVPLNKANGVPGQARRTKLSTKPDLVITAAIGSSFSSLTAGSSGLQSASSLVTFEKRSANRNNGLSSSRESNNISLNVSKTGSTAESRHLKSMKTSLLLPKVAPGCSFDSIASQSPSSTKVGKSFEGADADDSSSPSRAFFSSLNASENTGSLAQPIDDPTKSFANGDFGTKPLRPSGIRMPRPKSGYFEKEKILALMTPGSQNNIMKRASTGYVGVINKMIRKSELPSALLKQASKSAKANVLTKIENHQKVSPIVTKKEESNILKPDVLVQESGTETIGEQNTTHCHSSSLMNNNSRKGANREIEKENMGNDLKTENRSDTQLNESRFAEQLVEKNGISFNF